MMVGFCNSIADALNPSGDLDAQSSRRYCVSRRDVSDNAFHATVGRDSDRGLRRRISALAIKILSLTGACLLAARRTELADCRI